MKPCRLRNRFAPEIIVGAAFLSTISTAALMLMTGTAYWVMRGFRNQ
jgi:hypothetical protein